MGCDGGTKAIKRSLVVKKPKEERNKKDKFQEAHIFWNFCRFTRQPFSADHVIVCDHLGFLYDKQSVLFSLLEKKFQEENFVENYGHITQISDLQDVNFTINTNPDNNSAKWICPFSMKSIEGPYKFLVNQPCGHVVSKQAFDQLDRNTPVRKCCCVCNKKIENVIILNNDLDKVKRIKASIMERKMQEKSLKRKKRKMKRKRKKKRKREENEDENEESTSGIEPPEKKRKLDDSVSNSDVKKPARSIPDHIKSKLFFSSKKDEGSIEFLTRGNSRF